MIKSVTYSDQQKEIINYSGDQLLIRGIAGSGKTLVLLEKASDVAKKNPKETVAVFSFGNPLSESAKKQLGTIPPNLSVMTFHSWAMKNYFQIFGRRFNLEEEVKQKIKNAIEDVRVSYPKHRFISNKHLLEFIGKEISWIKGSDLCVFDKYDKAPRKGRGGKIRMSAEDRKVMFHIYEAYEKQLKGKTDFDDFGLQMSGNLKKIPDTSKFDHVFIDEAQDLTKVNLTVLCSIARKSCIVGADKGQKIFTTSFTWESVGLNIKGGRTKILKNSYRSTKQIMQLAYSIQEKDEISKDEEFTRPELPTEEGPIPKVVFSGGIEGQNKAIIENLELILKKEPEATIGILSRKIEQMKKIENILYRANIPCHLIQSSSQTRFPQRLGSHHDPGIKLTTFHTAKGLEFKYVLISDLVDPDSEERLGEDFDWDLERRLLYVAMSRAKKLLNIFTYGDRHTLVDELNPAYYEKVII
ncbi:3'-5' exonuclease [Paenibacillus vini]|uniref:3'-5' exonuclease n=1 Tax=Paenibacillus vini TaxID=1476024 RepID=UPI0025B6D249|nr:3'-5' exonuclease [Paenibacillus vini]MDN4066661.1 3'-5' exonuclease [Paenibacillus vini]